MALPRLKPTTVSVSPHLMERLIDLAARRHGFDRAELRRRNLAPAPAMPTRNPLGMVNDSGDYVAVLDRALARAEWAGFAARRGGRYRRIGLANYIELNSGMPRERAKITVRPEGRIDGGHAAARCSMRSSRGPSLPRRRRETQVGLTPISATADAGCSIDGSPRTRAGPRRDRSRVPARAP